MAGHRQVDKLIRPPRFDAEREFIVLLSFVPPLARTREEAIMGADDAGTVRFRDEFLCYEGDCGTMQVSGKDVRLLLTTNSTSYSWWKEKSSVTLDLHAPILQCHKIGFSICERGGLPRVYRRELGMRKAFQRWLDESDRA
jgi:hypothetical protein